MHFYFHRLLLVPAARQLLTLKLLHLQLPIVSADFIFTPFAAPSLTSLQLCFSSHGFYQSRFLVGHVSLSMVLQLQTSPFMETWLAFNSFPTVAAVGLNHQLPHLPPTPNPSVQALQLSQVLGASRSFLEASSLSGLTAL